MGLLSTCARCKGYRHDTDAKMTECMRRTFRGQRLYYAEKERYLQERDVSPHLQNSHRLIPDNILV